MTHNQSSNQTELQKATENVDPSQLSENLDKQNSVKGEPQDLDISENTPFIDESLRTDNR
ncbi:hypothetical protein GCM10010099_06700 [Streptomyces cinereus]|nr:hypothetical protein GCM10010099_06700 [Streptomyces cinereus]